MAQITVYPPLRTVTVLADDTVVTSTGRTLDYTDEIRGMLSRGELLTENPAGTLTQPVVDEDEDAVFWTDLDDQVGEYGGQVITFAGRSELDPETAGIAVWDSTSEEDPDGGTVIGNSSQGRWLRPTGVVTPQMFGAAGDGVTDDTTAIRAAILHDHVDFGDSRYTYLIRQPVSEPILSLTSRTGVHWIGRGATLKVASSAVITGYAQMLKLVSCSNCEFEGLTFDGNRSGRDTSGGNSVGGNSMAIHITGGSKLRFRNIDINNSTWDGFYIRASTESDPTTRPSDVLIENCSVYYGRRNGISLIGAQRVTIRGFRGYGMTGDPGAGIDIEPNAADVSGCEDILIDDCLVYDNAGLGLVVTGANSTVRPKRVTVRNLRGRNNGKGFFEAGYCEDLVVDGVRVSNDTTAITNVGFVQIDPQAFRVTLRNLAFRTVTGAAASKFLIYANNTTTGNVIDGVTAYNCACSVIGVASPTCVSNVHMDTITAGDYGIQLGTGGVQKLSNVYATNVTERVIQAGGTLNILENITIVEPSTTHEAVRIVSGLTSIDGLNVYESGDAAGTPVEPLRFDSGAAISSLKNVYMKAAGTDYTSANAIQLPTSLAGAIIRNVWPNPMANTATWDPGSLASGASVTSSSITVTGAVLGDMVRSSHSVDLQGLTSHAYVSAANTVKVVLSNLTGGAVDLASHTVSVEVIK